MTVRCKMQVTEKTTTLYGGGVRLRLQCIYDPTVPEDQRFSEATPSGSMEVYVNNPAAVEALELGRFFYLDLTPIEPPA